jgi:hypothetical protein
MHRRMTEVLLDEIGRVEGPDSDFCGEAYVPRERPGVCGLGLLCVRPRSLTVTLPRIGADMHWQPGSRLAW